MLSEGILRNNFEERYQSNFPGFFDEKNFLGQNIYVSHDHQNQIDSLVQAQQRFFLNLIMTKVNQNTLYIQDLEEKVDWLDNMLGQVTNQLENQSSKFPQITSKIEAESQNMIDNTADEVKKGRIHFKQLFRQRIFGMKEYKFKLQLEKKIPYIFYKQRNISFNVNLVNSSGQIIPNSNAISLNLKAYYSNGEQVGPTKKGENFLKGSVNSTMVHGKAPFNKVYPRQVSKKLERRKIILIVYASRMANSFDEKINKIDPQTIEPLIIYGIKVITKKSRDSKQNLKANQDNESSSQFHA